MANIRMTSAQFAEGLARLSALITAEATALRTDVATARLELAQAQQTVTQLTAARDESEAARILAQAAVATIGATLAVRDQELASATAIAQLNAEQLQAVSASNTALTAQVASLTQQLEDTAGGGDPQTGAELAAAAAAIDALATVLFAYADTPESVAGLARGEKRPNAATVAAIAEARELAARFTDP